MHCLPWVDKWSRPSFVRHLVTSPQPGMATALQSVLQMPAALKRCYFLLVFYRTSRLRLGVVWAHTVMLCGLPSARLVHYCPSVHGVPRGLCLPKVTEVHLHSTRLQQTCSETCSPVKWKLYWDMGETHLGRQASLSPSPAHSTATSNASCHKLSLPDMSSLFVGWALHSELRGIWVQ